jgi:hypothetical protein
MIEKVLGMYLEDRYFQISTFVDNKDSLLIQQRFANLNDNSNVFVEWSAYRGHRLM